MESLESGQGEQSMRHESLSIDEDELFSTFFDLSAAVDSISLRQPGPFFGEHPPSKSKDSSSQQQHLFAPTCALSSHIFPVEDLYALENDSRQAWTLPEREYRHESFHREPVRGNVAPSALQLPQDGPFISSPRVFGGEDSQFESTIELQNFQDQAYNVTSLGPVGDPTQSCISERRRLLASLSDKDLTGESHQWITLKSRPVVEVQPNSRHGSFQQFKIVKPRPKGPDGPTKMPRKGPACIICRWNKRECTGGTPCIACANRLSRLTSWSPCIKADFRGMKLLIIDSHNPIWSIKTHSDRSPPMTLHRDFLKLHVHKNGGSLIRGPMTTHKEESSQFLIKNTYSCIESFRRNQLSRKKGLSLLLMLKTFKVFLQLLQSERSILGIATLRDNIACLKGDQPIISFDHSEGRRILTAAEEGRARGNHLYAVFDTYEQLIQQRLGRKNCTDRTLIAEWASDTFELYTSEPTLANRPETSRYLSANGHPITEAIETGLLTEFYRVCFGTIHKIRSP